MMRSDEQVGFEPGPHFCDQCKATFQHTPWAFQLMDLRFEESLRFCSVEHLREYERASTHDQPGKAKDGGGK